MSQFATQRAREFYAQTYDAAVSDWPGEIDFYRELATEAQANGRSVLEVACGTGRVALRLAQDGVAIVGLDLSPAMLAVARQKSAGLTQVRWVQADMRAFDLGQSFGLVLIPGHAFQNLVTTADQVACLTSIKRHLAPGGRLVVHLDHLDVGWLGDLQRAENGITQTAAMFEHPQTGRLVRTTQTWSYKAATQTAISQTTWEEIGPDGQVIDRWDSGPLRLHCLFPFEMAHLLARTGFESEAVYGNFYREALTDSASEMIWLAGSGVQRQ